LKSLTRPSFWRAYDELPNETQHDIANAYSMWSINPRSAAVQFKQVGTSQPPLYSLRVTLKYRALGVVEDDVITWLWVGKHTDADQLLNDGTASQ